MGDAVVQVPGDPEPVLRDPPPGLLVPGPLEVLGPCLELDEVAAPVPHGLAEEQGGGRPPHEDELQRHWRLARNDAADRQGRAQDGGPGHRASTGSAPAEEEQADPSGDEDRAARVVAQQVGAERRRDDGHRDHRCSTTQSEHAARDDEQPDPQPIDAPVGALDREVGGGEQEERNGEASRGDIGNPRRDTAP